MAGRRRRRRFGRPPKHRVLDAEPGPRRFMPVLPAGNAPAMPGVRAPIDMSADEYEAYRLTEYLGLNQEEAAERMGISRGTLWRVLQSAKKKLARMMVEGRRLQVSGGHYVVGSDGDTSTCPECEKEKTEE
jgi:predicted DNA-binding protein (UPF0251 family)